MKKYTSFLMVLSVVACTNHHDFDISTNSGAGSGLVEFTQFASLSELLVSVGDFSEEDCTLKILSYGDEAVHIQVSNTVNAEFADERIKEQVKRNVVYVALQAFARTNIDHFTITSIPVSNEMNNAFCLFLDEFRLTETIKRKSAMKIIDNYLGATSFRDLYQYNSSISDWRPNYKFRFLQYDILDVVYGHMIK